jgi:hypothetical protein
MGFNKRFITEDAIKKVYKEQGYEGLVNYITKPDALLIRDEFSDKIVTLINEKNSKKRVEILMGYE